MNLWILMGPEESSKNGGCVWEFKEFCLEKYNLVVAIRNLIYIQYELMDIFAHTTCILMAYILFLVRNAIVNASCKEAGADYLWIWEL